MPKVVGPGAQVVQDIAPDPLLQGASELEYVTVHNPLTDDFQVRVAQSVPVNIPLQIHNKTQMVQSERDITQLYGLGLKNPDHQAQKYIYNDTIIPAGETKRFRGDMAQVAVRQLVNEIMQREGKKRFLADPTARNEVEQRVIKDRGSVADIMEGGLKSHTEIINETIDKSNEVNNEQAFPGLTESDNGESSEGSSGARDENPPSKERTSNDKSGNSNSKTTK